MTTQINHAAKNKILTPRVRILSLCAVLSIFASCYLGCALLLHDHSFTDGLALRPSVYRQFHDFYIKGAEKENLSIPTADNQKLDAFYFAVPGSKRLAIVNHGNAGTLCGRAHIAQLLTSQGVSVLLYDYRGYGRSTGDATIKGIIEDGLTAYSYATEKLGYSGDQLIEYGESIGSGVACAVASQRPCAALMLQCPLDSLVRAGRFTFPILSIFPDFCMSEPRLDNETLIKNIHIPVFICHGIRDIVLRSAGSQVLYNAANQPKTLLFLPNCGHNDIGLEDRELLITAMSKFLHSL